VSLPDLPEYATAQLTRLTYVRFRLDHDNLTATAIGAGPLEAKHSSANGIWIHAQLEPFKEMHRIGEVPGLMLRLMGEPFRGLVVYDVVETTDTVNQDWFSVRSLDES